MISEAMEETVTFPKSGRRRGREDPPGGQKKYGYAKKKFYLGKFWGKYDKRAISLKKAATKELICIFYGVY